MRTNDDPLPTERSAVGYLASEPDVPRVDVHADPSTAQALSRLWRVRETLWDGVLNWIGPYVDDPDWEAASFRRGMVFMPDPSRYVGPLVNGHSVREEDYYGTEDAPKRERVAGTPNRVQLESTRCLLVRERVGSWLYDLVRSAPGTEPEASRLLTALDEDLRRQARLLGDLRVFFCAFGPNSLRWTGDAKRVMKAWNRVTDWNLLTTTPLFRQAQWADWDVTHPPLRVTEEELMSAGLSVAQAKGCMRVLRACVDRGEVPNERGVLVAKALAVTMTKKE